MAEPGENLPSYKDIDEKGSSPPTYPSASDVDEEEARPQFDRTIVPAITAQPDDPPTYDSIFGKIKSARTEHGNSFGFFKALLKIIAAAIGGIVCVVSIAALLALPIAQLVIGVQKADMCPAQDKIPLWLTVSGAFGIIIGLMTILNQLSCKRDDGDGNPCLTFLVNLMNLFLFAWFICGNVWVYKIIKTVNYDKPLDGMYCDQTTFLFALWSINLVYIILGAACLFSCCTCCLVLCIT